MEKADDDEGADGDGESGGIGATLEAHRLPG